MLRILLAALVLVFGVGEASWASLTVSSTFNPSGAGSLCGLGFDPAAGEVWVYACSGTDIQRYTSSGTFLSAVTRPGESANDVDVEIAPVGLNLGAAVLPAGSLLFINGEAGPAEIYAVDKATGAILATLNTAFGVSHVVGGAYHKSRSTLFLIQDRVPVAAEANRIAEINRATGSVVNTFPIAATFDVNFGDLEVCAVTGNLLVASSDESRLAEYGPTGVFIQYHDLPAGVSLLSGIAVDDLTGDIWVANTGGNVWRLAGGPCDPPATVPALTGVARASLAFLLLGTALGALAIRASRARFTRD